MKQANLDYAISLFEQLSHTKVYAIRPVEADLCNESYLINLLFLLRIKTHYAVDQGIFEPKREYEMLRDISASTAHDILPEILAYDSTSGNMLTKYVSSPSFIQEKNGEFIRYLSLIESLKKLHALKKDFAFVNPILLYNDFKKLLGEEFHKEYEEDLLSRCQGAFSRSPIVPCHNHLDSFSFLYDEKRKSTKLAGFEFGGNGFEICDLASLLCENDITGSMKERLIHAYYGVKNVTQQTIDDVSSVMELYDMVTYLFASLRYRESLEEVHLALAKKKMARIRKSIRVHQK